MRKITRKFAFFMAIATLFAGCDTSNDNDNIITENEFSQKDIKALSSLLYGNSISESEVVSNVESIMNMINQPNSATRSSSRRIAEVIPAIGNTVKTRSFDEEEGDTLAYIVNFADDMGFVFASADRRTDFILAISPDGNIELDADISNSGLEVFFANLEVAYNRQIEETEAIKAELLKDSTFIVEQGNITTKAELGDVVIIDNLNYAVNKIVGPFVTVGWNQLSPYNDNAPIINGQKAAAGCVSVAMAQMLSYYRYPRNYDWVELNKYPIVVSTAGKVQVAQLFRTIGNGINTKWNTVSNGGSGALVSDADDYFRSIGFSSPGEYSAYDTQKLYACLDNNIPVIMSGFSLKETYTYKEWFLGKTKTSITYNDGHAWLVDGYLTASYTVSFKIFGVVLPVTSTMRYIHCNWGNGTAPNGYYSADAFDYYSPITRSSTTIEGKKNYYQFKLEALYNARP